MQEKTTLWAWSFFPRIMPGRYMAMLQVFTSAIRFIAFKNKAYLQLRSLVAHSYLVISNMFEPAIVILVACLTHSNLFCLTTFYKELVCPMF